MPGPEKLVSIFLEGLTNKSLHASLYGKKHTILNDCIYDAIDIDDNCDIYGKDKPITGLDASSARSSLESDKTKPGDAEAIAEMVMQKMNQVFRPPQRQYRCELCGGDHPTSQCLPKQNIQNVKPPRTDKWCDFEQKWTNHESQECYHRIRYLREQGMAQQPMGAPQPQYYQRVGNPRFVAPGVERAQPVLGNQPPLPGTAPVRFLLPDETISDGALVPVSRYYDEESEITTGNELTTLSPPDMPSVVPER